MNLELLCRHIFQFISFCPVFHADASGVGRIQINDDCHLLHFTRGTGTIFIENKKYPFKQGIVAAIPPFVPFYFKHSAKFEMLNIHYRIWLANGDPLEERASLPLIFKPDYFVRILDILRNMEDNLKNKLPDSLLVSAQAHELIIRHLISNELIAQEHKIIDARLTNACRKMSLPDYKIFKAGEIASLCGLSVSQMNRLFRKCFRMAPHKFWEKKRFVELCHQLRSRDLPASKIAARFGMEDSAYFSRWFKKMAGCAPSEFRQRGV
ncbi:MAG: AraC family transcriptional regulator [Kiritimatiellae bacterium]|nr:AraC family transcriptional regulator [Kiritimatiellia bacterium]